MRIISRTYNILVAAAMALWISLAASAAMASEIDELFARLADPNEPDWQHVEQEIMRHWDLSGSPSADLLLRRGKAALEAGETDRAIDHLTALVDHAPEFAEGWVARAAAYHAAGLYGPALYDLRQALVLEPRHFGALTGIGVIYEELGRVDVAHAAYEAALALNPHMEDLYDAILRLGPSAGGEAL